MSSLAPPIDDGNPAQERQATTALVGIDSATSTTPSPRRARRAPRSPAAPLTRVVPAPAGDAIRSLLNRYEMSTGNRLPSVIAVASSIRGEGVTTVSQSLTSILATDLDVNVCWVDLSWSAPASLRAKVEPTPAGVSEVLRGSAGIRDVIVRDQLQEQVSLIRLGDVSPGDQSRLARSPQLAEVIRELALSNEFVVIDAGGILDSTEASIAVRKADAHVFVVRHGATSARQVQAATEQLRPIPLLGALLNRYHTRTPSIIRKRITR